MYPAVLGTSRGAAPPRIILRICILTVCDSGFGCVCLLRLESVNTELLVTLNVPPSAQQGPIATTPEVFVKVGSACGLCCCRLYRTSVERVFLCVHA